MRAKALTLAMVLLWGTGAGAAQDFDGSTGYANAATAEVTSTPLSFSCWVKSDSDSAAQVGINVHDRIDANEDSYRLQLRGPAAGDPGAAISVSAATAVFADTATGYSTATWHSVVAVFTNSTSRAVYLDGANKGTNATASSPADITNTTIGATWDLAFTNFFDGMIAECGTWNVALTDDEAATLAKGFAPPCVRRSALIAYYPMVRDTTSLKDLFSATPNHLTLAGTTAVADHPPITNCQ